MLIKTKLILGLGTTAVIAGGSTAVYYGAIKGVEENKETKQTPNNQLFDQYFGEDSII